MFPFSLHSCFLWHSPYTLRPRRVLFLVAVVRKTRFLSVFHPPILPLHSATHSWDLVSGHSKEIKEKKIVGILPLCFTKFWLLWNVLLSFAFLSPQVVAFCIFAACSCKSQETDALLGLCSPSRIRTLSFPLNMLGFCYKGTYKQLDFKANLWRLLRVKELSLLDQIRKYYPQAPWPEPLILWQIKFIFFFQLLKEQIDVPATACSVLILLSLIRRLWTDLWAPGLKVKTKAQKTRHWILFLAFVKMIVSLGK